MKTFRITSICWLLAALFSVCCFFAKAEASGDRSLVVKKMHDTDLYGVDAHGDSIWAVGGGGLVFYSPDAGKSWQLQDTGIINELFSVSFVDAMNGWAVGRFGVIVHTSDGGKSWKVQRNETPETKGNLYKVQFIDEKTGWAVGEWSAIAYTSDGGKTWVDSSLGEDKFLYGMCFVDSENGWVVGEQGIIARTSDGGKTWARQESAESEKSLYAVYFKDQNKGWACGIDGIILWSEDGGENWQRVQTTPGEENLYDVGCAGDKLWAVGMNGVMIVSDNGLQWNIGVKEPLTYQWLMNIAQTDSGRLIIGGAGGTILISSTGGESWYLTRQMRTSASANQ
ncbi:MAG: hypothetical protein JRF40_14590 [Deltaproteobacteria bacterium]|nr:hypothetical protein [Deltaproteobacteria bacterium]